MPLAHITINGRTYCDHTGCLAGLQLADAAGVHTCTFPSQRKANEAARKLRAAGARGVAVVPGDCPVSGSATPDSDVVFLVRGRGEDGTVYATLYGWTDSPWNPDACRFESAEAGDVRAKAERHTAARGGSIKGAEVVPFSRAHIMARRAEIEAEIEAEGEGDAPAPLAQFIGPDGAAYYLHRDPDGRPETYLLTDHAGNIQDGYAGDLANVVAHLKWAGYAPFELQAEKPAAEV